MQRDLYIDFAKGFATLSVIFIHITFWSGQMYVPTEMRVFSLLFDVVLFYALSGFTSGNNIEKTFYRLLKLQITYMIFVTFLFFADYFFKLLGLTFFSEETLKNFYSIFGAKYVPKEISYVPQWQNLGNWYLHKYSNADTFPVVMGSFWYLKVYYILSVLGVLIFKFFPRHINWFIAICIALTLIFNIFPQYYPSGQTGYVAFYLAVFLIAHQCKGKKLDTKTVAILYMGVVATLVILFTNYGMDVFYKLNKNKFPPKMPYIIWTLFSIVTLFALYNRLKINKKSFLTYIGNNAIFFYFAQGISSTIIYFFVAPLHEDLHWTILLLLAFALNVLLATIIAKGLQKLDEWGWKILTFLRKITANSIVSGYKKE